MEFPLTTIPEASHGQDTTNYITLSHLCAFGFGLSSVIKM
jgi:hypothetical protein